MTGIIEKNGHRLTSLKEWRIHAGPKRDIQWRDDRSAKESAKAWLADTTSLPLEISSALYSHDDISVFSEWRAEPEASVRFDSFRGEPANLDMLVVGQDDQGSVVVAVEAKADESFGRTLDELVEDARSRLAGNPRSKGLVRVERILTALFGSPAINAEIADLRYQLMTASAAAVAEATRCSTHRAVVLVHEFNTVLTTDEKHKANANDLDRFVSRVAGMPVSVLPGKMVGPFRIPGQPITSEPVGLYYGKAIVNLRESDTLVV